MRIIKSVFHTAVFLALLSLAIPNAANGQYLRSLVPSDPDPGESFGESVAAAGDFVAVGNHQESSRGNWAGAVYVYGVDNGIDTELAKLTASDADADQHFGFSVAMTEDLLAVGAPGFPISNSPGSTNGDPQGAVYVFRRNGDLWLQEAKITSPDEAANADAHAFGTSIALSGDRLIVGERLDDENGKNAGAAYIFERTGGAWPLQAKLMQTHGGFDHFFGVSVDIDGDVVLVGAQDDNWVKLQGGGADIFRFNGATWEHEAFLTPADLAAKDRFGYVVALSGANALITSRDKGGAGVGGAVYAFRYESGVWTEKATLENDDLVSRSFGTGLALEGDTLLIGARALCCTVPGVYPFQRLDGNWIDPGPWTLPSDPLGDTYLFGGAVALSGNRAYVGSYQDPDQSRRTNDYSVRVYDTAEKITNGPVDTESWSDATTPENITLYQNYPNPFNPSTTIAYRMAEPGQVRVEVFDLLGRPVRSLVDAVKPAGEHSIRFESGSLPSGVYMYRISMGDVVRQKSMLLLR